MAKVSKPKPPAAPKRKAIASNGHPIRRARTNRKQPAQKQQKQSPVYLDEVKPTAIISLTTCNCRYCKDCLRKAFATGLSSEPHSFPARCCGRPLDLPSCQKYLLLPLRRAYRAKAEEAASDHPFYCAREDCGEYILQDNREKGGDARFATCGMCHMKTCVGCKKLKAEHKGVHVICPALVEDEAIEVVRRREGWKRCPKCWCVVERTKGCDAIKCICKAQWCYKCGKLTKAGQEEDRCFCNARAFVDLSVLGDETAIDVEEDDDLPDLRELLGLDRPKTEMVAPMLEGIIEAAASDLT